MVGRKNPVEAALVRGTRHSQREVERVGCIHLARKDRPDVDAELHATTACHQRGPRLTSGFGCVQCREHLLVMSQFAGMATATGDTRLTRKQWVEPTAYHSGRWTRSSPSRAGGRLASTPTGRFRTRS